MTYPGPRALPPSGAEAGDSDSVAAASALRTPRSGRSSRRGRSRLLAAWSIWIGIAISARSSDVRVAQQLVTLASLPSIAVTTLIALNVIHATLSLAVALGAALLLADLLGWRIVSAMLDRERLVTGTRS